MEVMYVCFPVGSKVSMLVIEQGRIKLPLVNHYFEILNGLTYNYLSNFN